MQQIFKDDNAHYFKTLGTPSGTGTMGAPSPREFQHLVEELPENPQKLFRFQLSTILRFFLKNGD